jgi:manganese/zinc/iron transport system permease protein
MISELIQPFDFQRVVVQPWTTDLSLFGWIALMGFFVSAACGLVGNFLILRRMALVGDAISHSVLPGLAVAFLIAQSRSPLAMLAGAIGASVATTVLIEVIHRNSRVKSDAAIGITFTTLFAIGVILIALFADKVDLDQDCVLNGELALIPITPPMHIGDLTLGPPPVVRAALVALVTLLLVIAFYKELVVSSFDPVLSTSLGVNATFVHYALMAWLSVVVVNAFEAVGAILVIAMLILPGATASLLVSRLPATLALSLLHAALSTVLGLHLGVWLNCSLAAAMVVAGCGLFVLAWLWHQLRKVLHKTSGPEAEAGGDSVPEAG